MRRALRMGATMLVSALAPARAHAQTGGGLDVPLADSTVLRLSLSEARDLARGQSPKLLVARQLPEIARGELRQARTVRFNPEIGFLGGTNPELTLTQELEWAGQRRLRTETAQLRLTVAALRSADIERETSTEVSIAYYRALAAHARRDVVYQLGKLTDRLSTAVRSQLAEGEISVLDANLAEIEAGRARGRALRARREVITAELELKRLLGVAPNIALRLTDEPPTDDRDAALEEATLLEAALLNRPDVRGATAVVDEARTAAVLVRREALPNVRAGAVAGPGAANRGVGLTLGLSLPILNRNRGAIQARDAEVRRANLQQLATRALAQSEIATALAAYRTATEELRLYSEMVLEPARTNASLLDEAYRAGEIALTSLLLLRNQLIDAELGYWDAWLSRREARVSLDAASGALTLPSELRGTRP